MFWILAALMSAGLSLLIVRGAALRAGLAAPGPEGAEPASVHTHRRALEEIEDLAARGLLEPGEVEAARAEAARRLLRAAKPAWAARQGASPHRGRAAVLAAAAGAPLLALGVYMVVGAPGLPDLPYAARLAVWERTDPAALDAPRFVALLQKAVRERPGDPEALFYLAKAQAAAGDPVMAVRSLQKAVALAPDQPQLRTALAEMQVEAQTQSQVQSQVQAAGAAGVEPPDVQAMVAGLAERLKASPDDPVGWARLVRSYGVLGDTAAQDAALVEARRRFAGRPADLARIEAEAGAPAGAAR